MTRSDILREYRVVDQIIRNPGKFEGAHFSAPYFYDDAEDGFWNDVFSNESDDSMLLFQWTEISAEDRKQFPMIVEKYVKLFESDQGFVSVEFTDDCPGGE